MKPRPHLYLLTLLLYTSCALNKTSLYESCDSHQKSDFYGAFPSYREWTRKEKEHRENNFLANGRINTNPIISCFSTIHSINFVGCHKNDLLYGKYTQATSFDLKKWKDRMQINQKDLTDIYINAKSTSSIYQVLPQYFTDKPYTENPHYNIKDEMTLEYAKSSTYPEGYYVAECLKKTPYSKNKESHVVSIIFVKTEK